MHSLHMGNRAPRRFVSFRSISFRFGAEMNLFPNRTRGGGGGEWLIESIKAKIAIGREGESWRERYHFVLLPSSLS